MLEGLPSITGVRGRVDRILCQEAVRIKPRDIVVCAIDGVSLRAAQEGWQSADVNAMRSVFPTTSSSAWLSSLRGVGVDVHGVPGVVFSDPRGTNRLINVFEYSSSGLACGTEDNMFSDAESCGYRPFALVGDLRDVPGAWRDALLTHATPLPGPVYYAGYPSLQDVRPYAVCARLGEAINQAFAATAREGRPRLLWLFVDLDQYVHHHGYDDFVLEFLDAVDSLCARLAERSVVIAYSDHGLVETHHDAALARLLETVAPGGGAGRTRWIYTSGPDETDRLEQRLLRELPPSVALRRSETLFRRGSPAHRRVGELVLIAQECSFIAPRHYRYEHGSMTDKEMFVPFARWGEIDGD